MSESYTPPVVPVVLRQHIEDASALHATRTRLLAAPQVKLHHLRRFDDRLAAALDGIRAAGASVWPLLDAMLDTSAVHDIFVAGVCALEERNMDRLERLLALLAAVPLLERGLRAALGWVEPTALRDVVVNMLSSDDAPRRVAGLAACAMHRIHPDWASRRYLESPDAASRARALRTVGELGQRELLSHLGSAAVNDDDADCRFWAAWSAVLLGDRMRGLDTLEAFALEPSPRSARAFQLAWLAMSAPHAHERLRDLAQDPARIRWLIRGAGLVGDPTYVPWLINHMGNDQLARLAGEAFSTITGADLEWLDLERKPPEDFESGPNDDPDDDNVALDEDDGLPWPDQSLVQRWWSQNSHRFSAGQRYFIGEGVTREHCVDVLKAGYQRQRVLAAMHLCLLQPGTVLFEWRAPARRQAAALAVL